jgi:hypothetical protein
LSIIIRGYIIKTLIFVCLLPLLALSLYPEDKNAKARAGTEPQEPVVYRTDVSFRGFPWGTTLEEFTKKMGKPIAREETNGLVSLVYENVEMSGYITYMLAYFSRTGLEGGTYYFITNSLDELMQCYRVVQQQMRDTYGPTLLYEGIIREYRPYESSWDLAGGFVHLKVNTRQGEPVTLWCSSPALTKKLLGR